jgi:AraC family transcriptional regulator
MDSTPINTQQNKQSLVSAELPPTDYCTVAGRAHTSSALFELRTYDWRDVHEACLVPPSSYIELTDIRAVGRYSREQEETWCNLGSVRYHPGGDEFHCRWYEDSQIVLLCAFDAADVIGFRADMNKEHLSKTHDIQNPYLFNLLSRAQQEIANPGLVSNVILDALGDAILSEWKTQFSDILHNTTQRTRGEHLSQADLRNIVARIREQRSAPTVAELALEQGVSVRHFHRLFNQVAEEGISAVFKRERLSRAKDLLEDPTLLIKEVAYLCGFESSAAFCKAFRSSMGLSPQQFRLQTLQTKR